MSESNPRYSDSVNLRKSLRSCVFNKFPWGTDAGGLGTPLGKPSISDEWKEGKQVCNGFNVTLPQTSTGSRWHFDVHFLSPLVLWLCLHWPKDLDIIHIWLLGANSQTLKMVGWIFLRHSGYSTVSRKNLLLGQAAYDILSFSEGIRLFLGIQFTCVVSFRDQ